MFHHIIYVHTYPHSKGSEWFDIPDEMVSTQQILCLLGSEWSPIFSISKHPVPPPINSKWVTHHNIKQSCLMINRLWVPLHIPSGLRRLSHVYSWTECGCSFHLLVTCNLLTWIWQPVSNNATISNIIFILELMLFKDCEIPFAIPLHLFLPAWASFPGE